MLRRIFLLVLLGMGSLLSAQNLVRNPSFEGYTNCPISQSHLFDAVAWQEAGQTPDFYHTCSYHPGNSVPTSWCGTQMPASGQGYIGEVCWGCFNTYLPNIREYAYNPLLSPLVPGTTYYVSFKVSLADYADHACDHLGMKFCSSYVANNSPTNSAEFYNTTIITNKTAWTTVSGTFVAAAAYNGFMLGNWFNEANTNNTLVGTTNYIGTMAYYFFDDVYVGPTPFVLPVTFESWDLSTLGDVVQLQWQLDMDGAVEFVVEHATDGVNFEESQHVLADPDGGLYSYTEQLPGYGPSVMYRIRAIAADGGSHLSAVLEAERYDANVAFLDAYPSPAKTSGPLTVRYHTGSGQAATLEMVALDGRSVLHIPLPTAGLGEQSLQISLQDIAPGCYLLRVGTLTRKLVVTD